MSTSSFPQNQRTNNVFAFSKVRRLDFWRVMFFIKAPLSFGRKKHSWLDTSPRIPGRCKKTVMVPVISNGEMIGLSSFHCSNSFCHGKIPNIPKESWRVFFLHTSSWQHHTPQKQKKGACFPSPRNLGEAQHLPFFHLPSFHLAILILPLDPGFDETLRINDVHGVAGIRVHGKPTQLLGVRFGWGDDGRCVV